MKTRTARMIRNSFIVAAATLVPALALGQLDIPFDFADGTPIVAAEMNANFSAVEDAVNALGPFEGSQGAGRATGELNADSVDMLATEPFLSPRNVTCRVSLEVHIDTNIIGRNADGTSYIHMLVERDGTTDLAYLPPPNGAQAVEAQLTSRTESYQATMTRLVSVDAGTNVRFGCRFNSYGEFVGARAASCLIVYQCL